MARFEVKTGGLDKLSEDFKKLGVWADKDIFAILGPAALKLQKALKAKIRALFKQHTGKLEESIMVIQKGGGDEEAWLLVAPQDVHHKYKIGRATKRSKRGGTRNALASEVGFILNFGDTHHKATHWFDNTLEEEENAVGECMQERFSALCDEKGIGL